MLDVGCGNGGVSFLLADAVGASGTVHGVDVNQAAIDAARQQAQASGRQNVSFAVADINNLQGQTYDAVFGRRVLMYQPDASHTIQVLKHLLKPGGIMLFQESDESGSRLNDDALPLRNLVQDWIWETVRREGGNARIGGQLYGLMKRADLNVIDCCSESVLQTAETGSDLAWVVSMMLPRMQSFGIPAHADGLEDRLTAEMQHAGHAFVRDLAYGRCAQKQ